MITSDEQNQKYELFIYGYLTASSIVCDKILDNKKVGNTTEGKEVKKAFVPAIYTLKHALELIIKLFMLLIGLDNLNINHHEILKLFEDSKNDIETKIKQAYNKVKTESCENELVEDKFFYKIAKYFINEQREGVDYFIRELDKLEKIVDKYSQPNFVNINCEKEIEGDKKNTFFRYPFDQEGNSYKINYLDVNNDFQHIQEVIKEVKKDANDLRGVVKRILLMIDYVERGN